MSLSVRAYPSLGGSTISANLPYVFLVSCRVSSGRRLAADDDEGAAASWESDGVDIDRNTFSGSDTEACNIYMHGFRGCIIHMMIILRLFARQAGAAAAHKVLGNGITYLHMISNRSELEEGVVNRHWSFGAATTQLNFGTGISKFCSPHIQILQCQFLLHHLGANTECRIIMPGESYSVYHRAYRLQTPCFYL